MPAAESRPLPRPWRGVALGLLLAACLGGSGCVSSIMANRIIRAPNRQSVPSALKGMAEFQADLDKNYYSLATKVHVGPFPADLSVAVLEPGDYHLDHQFKVEPTGDETEPTVLSFHFHFAHRDPQAPPVDPKGTIVLLHGVMMAKESMLHWGFYLAQKGYRVVLVDLRGHGRSTGDIITYGARETTDLVQVLDEISRRNLVAGRVGVLGLSYGGAIAIDWAAHDPRIASIVALAPFSDARQAIDEFAHALMPKLVAHVSAETMAKAFALAAQRGQFNWEQTDVLAAARRLRQPVLLFHGRRDTWIPPVHSEKIKAAAPAGSQLLLGRGDHVTISVRLDPIAETVTTWFDQGLVVAQ